MMNIWKLLILTYDNNKSLKKTGLHPLSRKYSFGETTREEVKLTPWKYNEKKSWNLKCKFKYDFSIVLCFLLVFAFFYFFLLQEKKVFRHSERKSFFTFSVFLMNQLAYLNVCTLRVYSYEVSWSGYVGWLT